MNSISSRKVYGTKFSVIASVSRLSYQGGLNLATTSWVSYPSRMIRKVRSP